MLEERIHDYSIGGGYGGYGGKWSMIFLFQELQ